MPNPSGSNQWYNGKEPPEDELVAELLQYAKERLTIERRLDRLAKKFNYHIKPTKLKALNKKYNIPTVRKPPAYEVATSVVCEQLAKDLHRRNGPSEVTKKLAVQGYAIPRSMTRAIMHDNDPIGFHVRNPEARHRIPRGQLTSKGCMHELSCDGHEKFIDSALMLGGEVGFGIYGMREKLAGKFLHARVVPNARFNVAVGHLYLDFVEEHQRIPRQITVDKGNETGWMAEFHKALRRALSPELSEDEWKLVIQVRSVHNITIENGWQRWTKSDGKNTRTEINAGSTNGLFDPANAVHVQLFQWLWPKIVQQVLDDFREYWNCHRVRGQHTKLMPSGGTPNDIFAVPEAYGFVDLSIPVTDMALVHDLRSQLPLPRHEALRFVDDEFQAAAEEAYTQIGSPHLRVERGWDIFSRMGAVLQAMYDLPV